MPQELRLPFCPVPAGRMFSIAENFRGLGGIVLKVMPSLAADLRHSELYVEKEVYGATIAILGIAYFIVWSFVAFAFTQALGAGNAPVLGVFLGAVFSFLIMLQLALFPGIRLKKKIRDLERNLIFALRTILVEIKSGVTLFDSISIVSEGQSGQVSTEFRKAVDKIETGSFQNEALEEIAEENPSLYFRRAMWQLVNGLKAGSDVSVVMQGLVESLSKEKANQIRKYGNSLKLLSLLYMMLGAIIPALGLTFLIIISVFPQIRIGEEAFWGMLAFIVVGQFMYLGIIKSSRPTLLGD